jgi:uncharacterized protein YwqG
MKESGDWLDRAMSFVATFLGTGFALVVAWALTETFTSIRLGLGGSRGAVGVAILTISLVLAIWRARRAGRRPAAPAAQQGAGAGDPLNDRLKQRQDKIAAGAGKSNAQPASDPIAEMAAWIQADAKKKDDAHKARIRAHVERPVPPTGDVERASVAKGRSACLAIRHVFPPRHPQRSMSFLGGVPLAPDGDDFDHPMIHNREGLLEPLTFMGQIELSALPDGPGRGLLPEIGYLYFFAPMSRTFDESAMHFCVRYVPRKVSKSWGPRECGLQSFIEEPADLPYRFPWMNWREMPHYPRAYPRIEIELGWIDDGGEVEEGDPDAADGFPWEVAEQRRRAQLVAFHGAPVAWDPVLSWQGKQVDRLWVPYEGFPTNRHALEILLGFLKTYIKEEKQAIQALMASLASDAAAAHVVEWLQKQLDTYTKFEFRHRELLDHIGLGKPVDDKMRSGVLALLDEVRAGVLPDTVMERRRRYFLQCLPHVLNNWISVAAVESAEPALMAPDGVEQIPTAIIEALRYRHTVLKDPAFSKDGHYAQHQMLGKGDLVQTAADEMGQEQGYILLLQLSPDDPLGWSFGDSGVLQYWIHPADLAARRFENSILTIEGH